MAWEKSPWAIRTVPSTSWWMGRVMRRARMAAPAMPMQEAADADEQEDLLDLPQLGVHGFEGQADLDRAPAAGRPGVGGNLDLEDPDGLVAENEAPHLGRGFLGGQGVLESRLRGDELAVGLDERVPGRGLAVAVVDDDVGHVPDAM